MKYALILIAAVALTGCGTYEKTAWEHECIDGKLYFSIWSANMVEKDYDIKQPEHIERYRSLVNGINCTSENTK